VFSLARTDELEQNSSILLVIALPACDVEYEQISDVEG
jgi:hypothetical protein